MIFGNCYFFGNFYKKIDQTYTENNLRHVYQNNFSYYYKFDILRFYQGNQDKELKIGKR